MNRMEGTHAPALGLLQHITRGLHARLDEIEHAQVLQDSRDILSLVVGRFARARLDRVERVRQQQRVLPHQLQVKREARR